MTEPSDRWSTVAQLARLAQGADDATRRRLLAAIGEQCQAGATEHRAPTWPERLVASLPDAAVVVGLFVLGALGRLEATTAAALGLAVVTGRLYPRPPAGGAGGPAAPGGGASGGGGGGPPAGAAVGFVGGTLPALALSAVLRARPPRLDEGPPLPPPRDSWPELRA